MPVRPPKFRPPYWRPTPRAPKQNNPAHDRYHTAAWRYTRATVLERDGRRCVKCGTPGNIVHHKIEVEDGGTDDPANLETVCPGCHNRLHPSKGGRH